MKQSAHTKPQAIQPVSPGKWHVHFNFEPYTDEETGREGWYFDYVKVTSPDKDTIVNAIVRKKYSESEEFAILRKHQAGIDTGEFEVFNQYVESAKSITNLITVLNDLEKTNPSIEFEVIENEAPTYDEATQRLESSYEIDLEAGTYTQVWQVIDLTAYELAMKDWHHAEYLKRIKAPSGLIDQYPNIGVWMLANKLPMEIVEDEQGTWAYLYMNIIRPEHQALVDSLAGQLTIENRPVDE